MSSRYPCLQRCKKQDGTATQSCRIGTFYWQTGEIMTTHLLPWGSAITAVTLLHARPMIF